MNWFRVELPFNYQVQVGSKQINQLARIRMNTDKTTIIDSAYMSKGVKVLWTLNMNTV